MRTATDPQSYQYEVSETPDGGLHLNIFGRMDAENASHMLRVFGSLVEGKIPPSLTVDIGRVSYVDDFGALVLTELRDMITRADGRFDLKNASAETLSIINLGAPADKKMTPKQRPPNMFVRLGEAAFKNAADLKYLVSFVGSVFLSLLYVIRHPRSLRSDDTVLYMQKTGVDALPIVVLISFLLGLIMAFMSAAQLQQFGANIYVASLVSLAMVRELGPIMTAIIVAGRSGSAFAAEIGTMQVSEEVDALFTMGFDPTRFLAVPKIIASIIVVPFLTLFSDLFAIFGGLLVGVAMLDLTANSFIAQTMKTLTIFDVFWGLFKSAIFALLIAWIGCLRGFQVRGGAASVGQGTTSAVVSSIFLIILTDSILAVVLRYWGGE